MQFGTNHLGHFALTGLLLPLLLPRRSRPSGDAVLRRASGRAHAVGRPQLGARYRKWLAYGQSKLANLLFMSELDRRAMKAGRTIVSVAAHPGYASTHLQSAGPDMAGNKAMSSVMEFANRTIAESAAQGALPTLYVATMPDVHGGEYYGPNGPGEMRGYPKKVSGTGRARQRDRCDPAVGAIRGADRRRVRVVGRRLTGQAAAAAAAAQLDPV